MPINNMADEIQVGAFVLRLLIVFAVAVPVVLATWWVGTRLARRRPPTP